MNKELTTRVCENAIYLGEINGIKYVSNMENSLGLSRGYLSRCLNNPSKRIAIDQVDIMAKYFGVTIEQLVYHDLRKEKYGEHLEYEDYDDNTDLLEDL